MKEPLAPFLKWPGGKRWAAAYISSLVRASLEGRYYEPFLGGGAVYFHLRPRRATLSDLNPNLIKTYVAVRDNVDRIIPRLRRKPVNADHYYATRSSKPRTNVGCATRILYLNRTSFAGLYRENRRGEFNVPYGGGDRTPEVLWSTPLLLEASESLASATLLAADFEASMMRARAGDVVYCDPCYASALGGRERFVRYTHGSFGWREQERLARVASRVAARGATVLVSNLKTEPVRQLYAKAEAHVLERYSSISRKTSSRRWVEEYLFVLRPDRQIAD